MKIHLTRPSTLVVIAVVAATLLFLSACGNSDSGDQVVAQPTTAAAVQPSVVPDVVEPADPSAEPTVVTDGAPDDAPSPENEGIGEKVPEGDDTDPEPLEGDEEVDEEVDEATNAATEVEPIPCAASAELPQLDPADPDALPFPAEGFGLEPGRYTSDRLGLSFALDTPERFQEAGSFAATVGLFSDQHSVILQRGNAVGFITDLPSDQEYAQGVRESLVDLDTWIAQDGVTLVSESTITIGGYPALDLVFTVDESALERFGDVPFTMSTTIQVVDHPHRLLVVDVDGGQEPLLIQIDVPDQPEWTADVDALLTSVALGGVGPSLETLFAATPWDLGNAFSGTGPVLVDACTVSALAFGGVQFDLISPAVVAGVGSELWIESPSEDHLGFSAPSINIVAPEFTSGGAGFPEAGTPVNSIADAIAELEVDGYVLTPIEVDATLLGAPVTAFDFIQEGEAFSWFPYGNGVSTGFGWASEDFNWEGTMYLAETDFGVIIASYGGDIGTGDAVILEEQFVALIETLRPAGT